MRSRKKLLGPETKAEECPECNKGGDYDGKKIRMVESWSWGFGWGGEEGIGTRDRGGRTQPQVEWACCVVM